MHSHWYIFSTIRKDAPVLLVKLRISKQIFDFNGWWLNTGAGHTHKEMEGKNNFVYLMGTSHMIYIPHIPLGQGLFFAISHAACVYKATANVIVQHKIVYSMINKFTNKNKYSLRFFSGSLSDRHSRFSLYTNTNRFRAYSNSS